MDAYGRLIWNVACISSFKPAIPCILTKSGRRIKIKPDREDQVLFLIKLNGLEALVDGREDITDQRAHDGHGGDDDDSDEYQDQCVLNHALSFFLESEFHNV